jgi:hypothetical protein
VRILRSWQSAGSPVLWDVWQGPAGFGEAGADCAERKRFGCGEWGKRRGWKAGGAAREYRIA